MAAHAGVLTITFDIPASNSLKDKRTVVKHLLEKLRRELQCSAAEVAFQNRIRTAEIALAFVGVSRAVLERCSLAAQGIAESEPRIRVVGCIWEWL